MRERKGWSQQELAKRSKVNARTILNIETSEDNEVAVQNKTASGLCEALGERPEVLAGKAPLPKEGKPYDLHVQLNPQVRLNYDLVRKRYGVDILDIVNVAPLLFVAAAEESLQRQQGQVDKEADEYGKLAQLWYQIPNLSKTFGHPEVPWIPEGYSTEEYFAERRHAVAIKDLFEVYLHDDNQPPWEQPNPFADYLYEVSQRPALKNTIQVAEEDDLYQRYWYSFSDCIPDYTICMDILKEITLGSSDAARALRQGVVSISEIPEELWEPRRAGERVAWLEDKYRDSKAKEDDESDVSDQIATSSV